MRQQDVADLVGVSVRYYASLERGEAGNPSVRLLEAIASALHMTPAERSALHVLVLGRDPPMPAPEADTSGTRPEVPAELRELVRRLDPTAAAVTDEMWTVLARNDAMAGWIGEYCDGSPPEEQNLVLFLFSPHAGQVLPDVANVRRATIAGLHYQYVRHLGSLRFARLVDRLLATSAEARQLWERHELAFPPRLFGHRIRSPDGGMSEISGVLTALSARLSLLVLTVAEDLNGLTG